LTLDESILFFITSDGASKVVNQYVWIRQESGQVAVEENPRRCRCNLWNCPRDSQANSTANTVGSSRTASASIINATRCYRGINLNLSMAWHENVVNVFEHDSAMDMGY